MAYITKEQVAEKRKAIKAALPAKDGWKFSVRNEHHSSLHIDIMQYPKEYDFPLRANINQYYYDKDDSGWTDKQKEVIRVMLEIAKDGWWDKSDIMTDYFYTAWYINLGVGQYDRPAIAV